MRQSPAGQVDKGAGAKIVDQRNAALARQRDRLARADLLGETGDAIVRGVDLEHEPGFGPDRVRIILIMCAVGGADLLKPRAVPATRRP